MQGHHVDSVDDYVRKNTVDGSGGVDDGLCMRSGWRRVACCLILKCAADGRRCLWPISSMAMVGYAGMCVGPFEE